jgi:Ca2+-binding RTX toxin-like protein
MSQRKHQFTPIAEQLPSRIVPVVKNWSWANGIITINVTDAFVTLTLGGGMILADGHTIWGPGTTFATVGNTTKIEGYCGGGTNDVDGINAKPLSDAGVTIPCRFTGSAFRDSLVGGGGLDTIEGFAGDDTLSGENGNDTLSGSTGFDKLFGGDGNDDLDGGPDVDTLLGGNNDDTLKGGLDTDSLIGGSGNDSLKGEHGGDWVFGESDNDTLDGGGHDDYLDGGSGNDTLLGKNHDDDLIGGPGEDSLSGGSGNDMLGASDGEPDFFIHGGSGTDIFFLDLFFDDLLDTDYDPNEDELIQL